MRIVLIVFLLSISAMAKRGSFLHKKNSKTHHPSESSKSAHKKHDAKSDDEESKPGKITLDLMLDSDNITWEFTYHPSAVSEFGGKSVLPIDQPENMNLAHKAIEMIDHLIEEEMFTTEESHFPFHLHLRYVIEGDQNTRKKANKGGAKDKVTSKFIKDLVTQSQYDEVMKLIQDLIKDYVVNGDVQQHK